MTAPSSLSRRDLLRRGTAALLGLGYASGCDVSSLREDAPRVSRTPSVNEQIRVGVIGTGVRGKYLIGNLPESARVVALCDCARSRIGSVLEPTDEFEPVLRGFLDRDAPRCMTYADPRRLLDRTDLDAVIIATPDHHHAPLAVNALDAGLDVYLEKPMTLTIREGREIAEKVRATGRVLQVGSQQRTMAVNRFACEFLRDGGLGTIHRVELPNYPGPIASPEFDAEPIPDGFDWQQFLGAAPQRPHNRHLWMKDDFRVGKLLWRGWDLFRDYSGHLMTNWGAHSIDMVQYALGRDDSGPVEIEAIPSEAATKLWRPWSKKTPRPIAEEDSRFWPLVMRYQEGPELHFAGRNDPIRFHGEHGVMRIKRNHFEIDPPELIADGPDPAEVAKWDGGGHVARPHLENWLAAIATRSVPNAPAEVGHRTATICHLANIARELKRPLRWDPKGETFVNDSAADALLDR